MALLSIKRLLRIIYTQRPGWTVLWIGFVKSLEVLKSSDEFKNVNNISGKDFWWDSTPLNNQHPYRVPDEMLRHTLLKETKENPWCAIPLHQNSCSDSPICQQVTSKPRKSNLWSEQEWWKFNWDIRIESGLHPHKQERMPLIWLGPVCWEKKSVCSFHLFNELSLTKNPV